MLRAPPKGWPCSIAYCNFCGQHVNCNDRVGRPIRTCKDGCTKELEHGAEELLGLDQQSGHRNGGPEARSGWRYTERPFLIFVSKAVHPKSMGCS